MLLVLAIMLIAVAIFLLCIVIEVDDIMMPDDPTGVLPISAIESDVGCGV